MGSGLLSKIKILTYLLPPVNISLQQISHVINKFLKQIIKILGWAQFCCKQLVTKNDAPNNQPHHCIWGEKIIFCFTYWQKERNSVLKNSHLFKKWLALKHTMIHLTRFPCKIKLPDASTSGKSVFIISKFQLRKQRKEDRPL